jgi:hypothetical protein
MSIKLMRQKHYNRNQIVLLCCVAFSLAFFSCRSDSSSNKQQLKEAELENFEVDKDLIDDITTAKKIFYSLPSPLETAVIIKNAGAEYNENLLNKIGNADNYITIKSMALNLGVYTTDMSFASLFDQTQTTINYMNASKKLADGLGILDAIDDQTIERLEANINNREAIMDIISETFLSSSSYLKENERASVAAIVLVGGWIEGLYIGTQLVENTEDLQNNEMVARIVEQKLSFDILLKLLEQHKYDEDIQAIALQMKPLREIFTKIKINTSEVTVEPGTETESNTLKSTIEYDISPEVFNELTEEIKTLRSNFIL